MSADPCEGSPYPCDTIGGDRIFPLTYIVGDVWLYTFVTTVFSHRPFMSIAFTLAGYFLGFVPLLRRTYMVTEVAPRPNAHLMTNVAAPVLAILAGAVAGMAFFSFLRTPVLRGSRVRDITTSSHSRFARDIVDVLLALSIIWAVGSQVRKLSPQGPDDPGFFILSESVEATVSVVAYCVFGMCVLVIVSGLWRTTQLRGTGFSDRTHSKYTLMWILMANANVAPFLKNYFELTLYLLPVLYVPSACVAFYLYARHVLPDPPGEGFASRRGALARFIVALGATVLSAVLIYYGVAGALHVRAPRAPEVVIMLATVWSMTGLFTLVYAIVARTCLSQIVPKVKR